MKNEDRIIDKIRLIDTHAHLYLPQFDEDRKLVIERAQDAGVEKIMLPNIDRSTVGAMHQMEIDYPGVCFPMMGLHPCSVTPMFNEELNWMEEQFDKHDYIGIGETGVDLHWDKTYQKEQVESFRRHIKWGKEKSLPVIIHSRESLALNMSIVKEMQDGRLKAIFHCFNGTPEQAEEIAGMGCLIGLGGVITFKNGGMKEILDQLPMENIVLETDAPYLSPVPFRGKRNESAYTKHVCQVLSEQLDMPYNAIAKRTTQTALDLFSCPVLE